MLALFLITIALFTLGVFADGSGIGEFSIFLFLLWLFLLILKIFVGIFRRPKKEIHIREIHSPANDPKSSASKGQTSKLAVTSFILSLIFFIPVFEFLAFILGLISSIKISRSKNNLKGNRFAISSVIISTIVILLHFAASYSPYAKYAPSVASAIDSNNPITRDFAVSIAKRYPGEFNSDQIISIYKHIKRNWKYVNDPKGFEYFSPASRTIQLGLSGDCDDFAIVMAATMKAIGADTRVVLASNSTSGHSYAEVNVGENVNSFLGDVQRHYSFLFIPLVYSIKYSKDKDGNWVNLDWFDNHPGGEVFERTAAHYIYPDGSNHYATK